jgi:hypothetical protein
MMLRHHTAMRHFDRKMQADHALSSRVDECTRVAREATNGGHNFFAHIRKNSIAMSKKPGYSCRSSHPESL